MNPDFLNFSHVMRTNQSKFSMFGRWKFIDHRFFSLFFRGIPLEETSSHDSMTKLFTSLHKVSSKAYFGKVFKRGLDEYLAPSRTKKPLISWFNEHGHPAHHHSFYVFLDYREGVGKWLISEPSNTYTIVKERRFVLKSKYNLLVDKIKWCLSSAIDTHTIWTL